MSLWGLDCPNPHCKHDSLRGYRLRIFVRRSVMCVSCGHTGRLLTENERAVSMKRRRMTHHCDACEQDWSQRFVNERHDMIFRAHQRDAALAQMSALGEADPGLGAYHVREHPTLPIGYDARLMLLTEEALPRAALYFRWYPMGGEQLTPDKVFQCVFSAGATAAERRTAPETQLSADAFQHVFQRAIPTRTYGGNGAPHGQGMVISVAPDLRCQHCQQPLPLAAFNTLTLREVEKGD